MSACACGPQWRVEAADLRTGIERRVLPVVAMDLGETLNTSSRGTLTLNSEDIALRDVFPDLTSIWVTRDGVCVWAGIVEGVSVSGGAAQIGLKTIDGYLERRNIREQQVFSQVTQTSLCASLVNYAQAHDGIPLVGIAGPSSIKRDRTYQAWERAEIGAALKALTEVSDGPDRVVGYVRSGTSWTATLTYVDRAGADRGVRIVGVKHLDETSGGVEISAEDHATLVDAIGAGEEDAMLISTSVDVSNRFARFDAAPAFKDVILTPTLDEHSRGYLEGHREPSAVPRLPLIDHSLNITMGDTVYVDAGYGAGTYRGYVRVVGWTWRARPDATDVRELITVPLGSAVDTMLLQEPRACRDC